MFLALQRTCGAQISGAVPITRDTPTIDKNQLAIKEKFGYDT
ncbi:MAG: hypothetical protein QME64_06100 [bacterium]|nr:hypothetical protein [bacterium]